MTIKKGEIFKLDQAWWKKHKPVTVKSTGLGAAIADYLATKAEATTLSKQGHWEKFDPQQNPIDAALDMATKGLPAAVAKAEKACSKTLHADVLLYLGTAKKVLSNEASAITTLKKNFKKGYTKIQQRMVGKAKRRHDANVDAKDTGHDSYKAAEGLLAELAAMAKKAGKISGRDAWKLASDSQVKSSEIEEHCQTLKDLATKAEAAQGEIGSLVQNREKLTPDDARALIKFSDVSAAATNALKAYRDKTGLFLQGAKAHLETIASSGTGDSSGVTVDDVKERLQELVQSMVSVKDRGREMSNTVVAPILNLRNATRDLEEAAKGQKIKVSDYPAYCNKVVADADKFHDKVKKLHSQVMRLKKTVMKTIPPNMLAAPELKDVLEKISEESDRVDELLEGMPGKVKELNDLAESVTDKALSHDEG